MAIKCQNHCKTYQDGVPRKQTHASGTSTLPAGQPRGTTLIPNIAANKNINASTIMFPP